MSNLNTLTGRNGKFLVGAIGGAAALVARITQWAVNPTLATSTEWGDSDSAGYTNRAPGRRDCTFTAEGKYESVGTVIWDLFQPEDILIAALQLTAGAQPAWNFPRALCTDFNLVVNIDTEEVIGHTSSWGADGEFSRPTSP